MQQPEHERPACGRGTCGCTAARSGEVVYDFTWARNREARCGCWPTTAGYLQADAAPAYDDVFLRHPELIEVGCWAHARRYFKDAAASAALPCAQVLALIGELYGIERAVRDRDAGDAQALRQSRRGRSWTRLQALLDSWR